MATAQMLTIRVRRAGMHHRLEPWRVGRPVQGARYLLDFDTLQGARFEVTYPWGREWISAYTEESE